MQFVNIPISSLYEATKNKLQGSGLTISKKATRVFKFTYFEIFVCLPTFSHEIQDLKLNFLMTSFEASNLLYQESYDLKRVEHDL